MSDVKPVTHTLLTGASSGIGRAIAVELSKEYNLILHGRNRAKLEETLQQCAPGDHRMWVYDLSQVDELQKSFEEYVRQSDLSIDQFVHCAGVALPCAIKTIDVSYVRHMIDVNGLSAILLTSSLMKKRVAGDILKSIVYISSLTAKMGTPGSAVYGASKGMINGFVKSAALEVAPRARVNAICPGLVTTPMSDAILQSKDILEQAVKRHPLGLGTPTDIANVVSFLLSPQSSWITGQCIVVDGGVSGNLSFKW